ncbi:MAG: hypothetical protein K6G92_10865 [Bacteroidaceae bacterium]|nr:hypothetical protein [Bacteroidaceae bacterium]
MKKIKLLLATAALMLGGSVWAQMTDVTDTYINNPSFESNGNSAASNANLTITGWTEAQSAAGSYNNTQTRDKDTDNASAFGTKITPADGTYYLFYRHGWNGDAGTTATFTTTTKNNLPAGVYRLEFKYQQSYNEDSSSKTKTRIKLAAINGETEVASVTTGDATKDATFGNDKWNTSGFFFKLDAEATIDFVFTMYSGGQKRSDFLLDNIRLLKANNPATPVDDKTADLYLYNEATSLYLSAGQSWGTHAIVDGTGQPITANLSDGVYTLMTQEYNAFVGSNLYMDGSAAKWLLLETSSGSGKYYMTADGYNYMTSNGAGAEVVNVTSPTEASEWTIVSKADRKTALESATIENPGNATFLIGDANFGRNCSTSPWTKTNSGGDFQFASGANENMNMQQWNGTFTITQTLASVPNGAYKLTAQGYYRNGSNADAATAYNAGTETIRSFLTANSETPVPLMSVMADAQASATGGFTTSTDAGYVPNSQTDASNCFSAGYYKDNVVWVSVTDGNLTIGAKCEENVSNAWTVLDNFELTYYGDVTIAAVKMKASVDAYNAALNEANAFTESSMFDTDWNTLQDAITANTLDLNDSGLTESQLTTATANLVAANTAATAAVAAKTTYDTAVTTINGGTNVDLTSLIVNPSFEQGNTNGWTNDGTITAGAQNNNSFGNKQGTYYAERWHAAGTIDINQTVAALPAGIYKIEAYMYSDVVDAKLYANATEVSVSTSGKYAATVEIADKGSIKMGAACTLTNSTWICIDDFKLTYVGTINDLTYTLASGKMGTDKSAAQTAAVTTFTSNKTLANYNALLTAIAEAETSVANYATLKTAIDKAKDVKDANNFVTTAATTALENEISTATTAWTNVTYTDAQATAEINALGSTVSDWHAIANEGKAGAYIASTWGKTNENWWDAPYINTWSTEGDSDGSGFSVPFFEYFVNETNNLEANTFTATLTGMENGWYEVELWARVQRRSDANFNSDNSMITMSVNSGEAVSIMSNTSNNVGSGGYVMRLGRYKAYGQVTDGNLTLSIDVKLGANVHWLCWRDIKYTKVEPVTVTAAGYATYASDNNLDFTDSSIKAYRATVSGSTLNFTRVDVVPAGEGVLLYSASGETTENVPVLASATPWSAGDNAFVRGTGAAVTYDAASSQYYYVLANVSDVVGFYQANNNTIATNRAYINAGGSLVKGFAIDLEDDATGINAIDNGELSIDNAAIYNLAGQRISKMQKGINIINGRKVLY